MNVTSTAQDITLCLRFNFKVLGNYGDARLITIEDWADEPGDPEFSLMWFGTMYPVSFFGFGYPRTYTSFNNWLLKDPVTESFQVWTPNQWSHVCFSYDSQTAYVRMVKVSK